MLLKFAKNNVSVSCDLNYRSNLWTSEEALSTMSKLVPFVDVLIGNEEDAEKALGILSQDTDVIKGRLNYKTYEKIAEQIKIKFGIKTIAFTFLPVYLLLIINGGLYYIRMGNPTSQKNI